MKGTLVSRRLAILAVSTALLYLASLFAWVQSTDAYLVATCCGGREIKFQNPQITWDGDFQDGQSYLGVFPPETRQDLRNSGMQWDNVTTNASLNVDESYSSHNVWWTGVPFSRGGCRTSPGQPSSTTTRPPDT